MKKIAVFGKSLKPNEKRIPLHPRLFPLIPVDVASCLYFEEGYGEELGVTSHDLNQMFGGVRDRAWLYKQCDVWLLPKPTEADYAHFSPDKILWGWPHCVQGPSITQAAIDKKMTIVAWEAMFGGSDNCHIFYRNNELAGYAAVQHTMMLVGRNGYFGYPLKAAVLGYGATARGAINSLKSLGLNSIDVFSRRPSYLINGPTENVGFKQIKQSEAGSWLLEHDDKGYKPAAEVLADYDIIVNCVLQDPTNPIQFVESEANVQFKRQVDIIDISCDKGMGFYFANPTTFDEPMFKVGKHINYYSVDHTPSLFWDSASYEITKSIIDFLPYFASESWREHPILSKAIEIDSGKIVNKKILDFQKRLADYPHEAKR